MHKRFDPTRPLMIEDDRGRETPLVKAPAEDEWPNIPWYRFSKDVAEPWRTELGIASFASTVRVVGGVFAAVPGFAALKNYFPTMTSVVASACAGVAIVLGLRLFAGFMTRQYRSLKRNDVVAAYLGVKRCASCGFEMKSLPVAEDGRRVCPECSSAWKVSDVSVGSA